MTDDTPTPTRRRRGRPPIGDRAMTPAERMANTRAKRNAAGLVRREEWVPANPQKTHSRHDDDG